MSRLISCLGYGTFIGSTKSPNVLVSRQFSALVIPHGASSTKYNHTHLQIACDYTGKSTNNYSLTSLSRCNNTGLTIASRKIFTENSLGIPKLDELRERKRHLFPADAKDRYVERLSNYMAKGESKSIYRDDLVNLLGIAETEQHLDLLEEIISKAEGEQAAFFRGWGATIMRLYYKMNQLERAEKNIKDIERFGEFFNLRSCYKILMTMFYNSGQYEKVIDMLHYAEDRSKDRIVAEARPNDEVLYDRDLTTLAFAALAKLNTQSAMKQAEKLLDKISSPDKNIGLRPASFFAYIAINNNNPTLALNLISKVPSRAYVSLREIKIMSLVKLERYEDVLLAMREHATSLKRESNLLLKSTYEFLQQSKEKIQDASVRQELDDILIEIKEGGHISEQTLDDLVFRKIDYDRSQIRANDSNNLRFGPGQRGSGGQFNNQFNRGRPPFRRNQYNDDNYEDADNDLPRYPRENRYEGRGGDERRGGSGVGGRGGKRFSHQNVNFDV